MAIASEQSPKTPPYNPEYRHPALLTPPPTGGFEKPEQYSSDETEKLVSPGLPSPVTFKRLELPTRNLFNDEADFSYSPRASIEDSQGTISSSLADSSTWDTESSTSSLTELSESEDEDGCQPLDYFAALTFPQKCRPVEGSFNFLGLPVVVRKRIYALILTVPALISVRQNRTRTYNESNAYLFAESRSLLPGT